MKLGTIYDLSNNIEILIILLLDIVSLEVHMKQKAKGLMTGYSTEVVYLPSLESRKLASVHRQKLCSFFFWSALTGSRI